MIHGYHLVLSTYGFWLPNDPRGSMSHKVFSSSLAKIGDASRSLERVEVASPQYESWRRDATATLQYPPVSLTGRQAFQTAMAIGAFAKEFHLPVWAFSILEEHVHIVLGRYRYKMELLANQLKGIATRRLTEQKIHPMANHSNEDGTLPGMWSEGQWIVYLDSEEAIEYAIQYVEENPEREGKKRQRWSFVQPFEGIPRGGWTTYF